MAGSQLMYELSEGNPGALSVVSRLDYRHLALLKHMGISGQFIWIGYKDICDEDIEKFKLKIEDGSIEKEVKATNDWEYYHGKNT